MNWQTVLYEKIDNIARITLNRPQKRNAQDYQLILELDEAIKEAERDDEVRVVILAGAGPSFSSGHDLSGMGREGERAFSRMGGEDHRRFEQEVFVDKCLYIRGLRKPTIAQVQGHCIAAGMMLACMCDLIVASEDARFSNPVVRMAASAAEIPVEAWELGIRKAKELLFTGDAIDAQEARRLGMVNRVVPRDRLEAEVMEMARRIALMPPVALAITKESLNRTQDIQGFHLSTLAHFDAHMLAHGSNETAEFMGRSTGKGLKGFLETRDSAFRDHG